jgi:hypothetical protein
MAGDHMMSLDKTAMHSKKYKKDKMKHDNMSHNETSHLISMDHQQR